MDRRYKERSSSHKAKRAPSISLGDLSYVCSMLPMRPISIMSKTYLSDLGIVNFLNDFNSLFSHI